ncbi:RICIN domain-containing protein [Streptomyces virginiae]|uniref:RICIN domain-containing protein n=1 Tax=Streptomyces virginiae TaxID=1961 RepID=UPI00371B6850
MTQTAAGEDPLVLRAFRTLSPALQQALCPELAEDHEEPGRAGLRQAKPFMRDVGSSARSARARLCKAYLRTYVAQAPSRTCRHLTAAMDDSEGGVSDWSKALDQHTVACQSCADMRADLAVLRSGSLAVLTDLLLEAAKDASFREEVAGAHTQASTPAGSDVNTAAGPGSLSLGPRPRGQFAALPPSRVSLLVAACVCVVATVIVAMNETSSPSDNSRPPRAGATVIVPPISVPAAVIASPAPSGTASAAASPAPSHSPRDPLPDDAATPTRGGPPSGLRLVNRRTGLCVGAQGRAAGAGLRLEECGDGALQRWEAFEDASGAYGLRNTGSDKCLDGTEGGGNIVRAALNDCGDRSSAHPAVQLWTITPEKGSGASAFRLHFVPRVPSSDYSSHLFGPEDWWNENPPREGSYLAHLPNYYNSESFVFTMSRGE